MKDRMVIEMFLEVEKAWKKSEQKGSTLGQQAKEVRNFSPSFYKGIPGTGSSLYTYDVSSERNAGKIHESRDHAFHCGFGSIPTA